EYGKLSKINLSGNRPGARVDSDEYEKDDPRDFVLWKAAKPGEPFWKAPFGLGRPGWHLECSAMAMKFLGETFDIHSGGVDLIFPHHENEIAQSEAATGRPFARFWLHAEHLMVNGEKMSKSLGNFYTLRDLISQGHKPSAIRYLLASVPFDRPLNFTTEGLHQAEKSIERIRNFHYRLTIEKFADGQSSEIHAQATTATSAFEEGLNQNLNTAEALAAVFILVSEGNKAMDCGAFRSGDRQACLDVLRRWDTIFAVLEDNDYAKIERYELLGSEQASLPSQHTVPAEHPCRNGSLLALSDEEIEQQINLRNTARRQGRYGDSDRIREQLLSAGVILEDTKAGTRWRRK
ncbi:MAG TPA: class I tRNA ligase family protein, partial [Terriglobia bacterium]|nr:class I tRNA ligase family protein [Terriglobia bacterium]